MENIYQETLQKIANGARVRVDLTRRALTVNGKKIIDGGKYEGELGTPTVDDPIAEIERLYGRYLHSIPSERSDRQYRPQFRALDESELSDEDMMFGERRDQAQAALELFVLGSVLDGSLTWETFKERSIKTNWFWQSPSYPSLIVLKSYITNTETNK